MFAHEVARIRPSHPPFSVLTGGRAINRVHVWARALCRSEVQLLEHTLTHFDVLSGE
jgi:hypothetical protein